MTDWSATDHAEYIKWYIEKYGKKEWIPMNDKLRDEFRKSQNKKPNQ